MRHIPTNQIEMAAQFVGAVNAWTQTVKTLSKDESITQPSPVVYVAVALATLIASEQAERKDARDNGQMNEPPATYDEMVSIVGELSKKVLELMGLTGEEDGCDPNSAGSIGAMLAGADDATRAAIISTMMKTNSTSEAPPVVDIPGCIVVQGLDDLPKVAKKLASEGMPQKEIAEVMFGLAQKIKEIEDSQK